MNLEEPIFEYGEKNFLESGVQYGNRFKNSVLDRISQDFVFKRKRKGGIGFSYIFNSKKLIDNSKDFYSKIFDFSKENSGEILFFCSKKGFEDMVIKAAEKCLSPYMVNRWVGGFLTNFRVIRRSVLKLDRFKKDLEFLLNSEDKEKIPSFNKRVSLLKREIKKMSHYEGVINLSKQPIAIFFLCRDKNREMILREASILNIPCISICNTNHDPNKIDYPIFGNDNGIKSVEFLLEIISGAILKGSSIREMEKELDKNADNGESKREGNE